MAGGVAHIELNRPRALNALNMELVAELERVVRVVSHSADVSSVVLSGRGGSFCAGGDVRAMANSEDYAEYIQQLADGSHTVIRLLDEMTKPLIACVRGAVA